MLAPSLDAIGTTTFLKLSSWSSVWRATEEGAAGISPLSLRVTLCPNSRRTRDRWRSRADAMSGTSRTEGTRRTTKAAVSWVEEGAAAEGDASVVVAVTARRWLVEASPASELARAPALPKREVLASRGF